VTAPGPLDAAPHASARPIDIALEAG